MFPSECFGPETLSLMTRALDAAWREANCSLTSGPTGLRRLMALRIMAAVRDGERDLEHLKELALSVAREV